MTTLSIRQAHKKWTSSQERYQQQHLLPGIPDDITLHEISPKLPWKAFYVLSSVSRAWHHAIRSRKVYDVRIRSHSMETFLIVNLDHFTGGIALWSVREDYLIRLPPIRHRGRHMVSFDGRIYLLGREYFVRPYDPIITHEVFVLDVAGQTGWRKCASMSKSRESFGCAVMHGKIHVFGGEKKQNDCGKLFGPEVYNPEKDVWSPIKSLPEFVFGAQTGGEEIVVFSEHGSNKFADFMDVYHPGKDEWRVVTPFARSRKARLFEARGKLHSMDDYGIDIYNAKENSWTRLHTFPFIEPGCTARMYRVLSFGDELLLKYWVDPDGYSKSYRLAKSSSVARKRRLFGSKYRLQIF